MRFEIHGVLYAKVADVPGRRGSEVMMRVRVERVVRGEVLDRPIHRWRPDVRTLLEQLRERPSLSSLDLQVRDRRRQVLEGLRRRVEQLDVREGVVDQRAVEVSVVCRFNTESMLTGTSVLR